ncbi:MAG TPA: tetratricopeptide repeat protein [Pyrinomonadaceae bacterium]|jgi:tetratricopeptide (TPR) repeat protein
MKKKESRFWFVAARALSSLLLAISVCACAASENRNGDGATTATTGNSASANGANAATDASGGAQTGTAKFDAEIANLEKQAEKNPGDDELRDALSQAYLRRANALRDAQQLKEALRDYRKALSNNPDNEEAQQRAAEIGAQVEGELTGENGEPAPLPISPNVTTDDPGDETPQASPPKETKKNERSRQ